MEEAIFKKVNIDLNQLLDYGFVKEKEAYVYQTTIINHTMQVIIRIINYQVKGTIIDLKTKEEYVNYRIETIQGEFVQRVREEYQKVLEEIAKNCGFKNYFVYPQSNRITNFIIKKYRCYPEFLWEKSEDTAVFRNEKKKWFGIIMNVNKKKLDEEDKEVEVLNVKLPEEKIKKLVLKKGYYLAYHMNKKYWISIILDDTLKDEEITSLIEESYELVNCK